MNREAENIEMTDNDVASVVSGLSTVKAPAGFERQVMTRIAEGAPRRSWFAMPVLAYAVPALIVLLIATFLIFRSREATESVPDIVVNGPAVQTEQHDTAVAAQEPGSNRISEQLPAVARQSNSQSVDPPPQKPKQSDRVSNSNSNSTSVRSITFATQPANVLMPEGISPKPQRRTADANSIISPVAVPVQDIFGRVLGISAKYENGWTVTSVSDNSAASRSGVKVGDVLAAINDRQLTSDTTYKGSGTFATVTVLRGGETLLIKLK